LKMKVPKKKSTSAATAPFTLDFREPPAHFGGEFFSGRLDLESRNGFRD